MTFETVAPVLIFVALLTASFGAQALYEKLPGDWQHVETHDVIHAATRLFIIMTSLMLGFMLNSAKNTYEAHDHNIHAYATQIVLLDKTLRRYGPDANEMRHRLQVFARRVAQAQVTDDPAAANDMQAEQLLAAVGEGLNTVAPGDPQHLELWHDATAAVSAAGADTAEPDRAVAKQHAHAADCPVGGLADADLHQLRLSRATQSRGRGYDGRGRHAGIGRDLSDPGHGPAP